MWTEYVRVAFRALRANKFRSALTVSSIMLGAFSIVLMASLASSGLTTLAKDIEELGGARMIMLAPKKPERELARAGSAPGHFTKRDRDILYEAVPHTEARSMFTSLRRIDAINRAGKTMRADLVVADAGFFDTLMLDTEKGRRFTEAENESRARICVVGFETAKKLFDGDAVGRWLTVDGERCRVIGQIAKQDHWDISFGFDWQEFVVMPLEAALETRPTTRDRAKILLRTDAVASNDIVKRVANAILVERHNGVDDFQIWDFNAFVAKFEAMFALMEAVVGLIAGIALFVGGIGVMNMMLVSVSERTREIGIRKALGASPKAIASQFLCEAIALAGIGGLVGTGAGIFAAIGTNAFIHSLQALWVGEVSMGAAVIAMSASVLIGVGFGFVPARLASRLDPVEAIRR